MQMRFFASMRIGQPSRPALIENGTSRDALETSIDDTEDVSKIGKASALLDHVEKTLGDNYRKEIDQEENVWRTLPFFTATIALEVAALTQLRSSILAATGSLSYVMAILAGLVACGNVVAFIYLARSVAFADFKYIASEPSILRYAEEVEQAAKDGILNNGESALTTIKRFLARQYAATTESNRAINQNRAKMRTSAGLITISTLFGTLLLGALTVLVSDPQVADSEKDRSGGSNAARQSGSVPTDKPSVQSPAGSGAAGNANPSPNPSGLKGLVHPPRDDGNSGAGGTGK